MNKEELYFNLYKTREKLKRMFNSNGKTPTICTDISLRELANNPPLEKDDMLAISGLGKTFVEKYGDYFMQTINSYHRSNTSNTRLNAEVRKTLKNLENRLINISKKNRLLYLSKASSRNAIDMFSNDSEKNQNIIDFIAGKQNQLELCKIDFKNADKETEKYYKLVSNLLREVSSDYKESGQFDLYIGYPYVIGKTLVEDFSVRAPLMLFPISYEKQVDKITIKVDRSKDVLYNNNLILMQSKFIETNKELPSALVEDFDPNNFVENAVNHYAENNIVINGELKEFSRFEEYTEKTFPKFNKGEYNLCNNAVIGKFSLYSTALQKDFKKISDGSEINLLVNDLLTGVEQDNYLLDNIEIEEQTEEIVDENNLHYINDLNSSQEQAIIKIDKTDRLVIQGPPGTGKSQTITSLIADEINKNHNVLMVSQKKAALDVIYSRLGNNSKYTLMINDTKNKELFYSQLKNLFACNKTFVDNSTRFADISNRINQGVLSLDDISNQLFTEKFNGTEIYKIYQDNINNCFRENDELENEYYLLFNKDLIYFDYADLKQIKEDFSKNDFLENCLNYLDINEKYNWLNDVKKDISAVDKKFFAKDVKIFKDEQSEYQKLNFFKKFKLFFKRHKEFNSLIRKYFDAKKSKKYLYKNPLVFFEGVKVYSDFVETSKVYHSLTSEQQSYVNNVFVLTKNGITPKEANERLFDFVSKNIIDIFEDENKETMGNVQNFDSIIYSISEMMESKKNITKEMFKKKLITSFKQSIESAKRYQEMQRQIESSRKWSVNKFVDKFDFELFKGINVWLMTPESVSEILPLQNGLFDIVVFDEGSQIYIEKGIPAISRAKKVVIAGDHKQLRPSSLGFGRIDSEDEEENAALEEESLLDLARFKYPAVLLNYHYRAKYEELINFSNYAFYNAKLNVSPNTEEPLSPPIEYIKVENGLWEGRSNLQEAKKVVSLIKDVLLNRQKQETIGVITFNVSQRDLILDLLDKECLKDEKFSTAYKKETERTENGEDISLFVKNIENVQGDERDIIIFSTAYAKNKDGVIVRNFGWLNQQGGENRLNVAISRAKRKIYFVSSIYPEELIVDDLKNEGPKLFRKYMEYCSAVSKKDTGLVKSILNSLATKQINDADEYQTSFQKEIYSALKQNGFDAILNVGSGGYKIDIALKKDNKYILGVECDGKIYTETTNSRERDIFKGKYFKARGWKIYRVWSNNWYHNKAEEIEKIRSLFEKISNN